MRRHIHHLHIIILGGIILIFALALLINNVVERIYLESPDTFGVSFAPRYARELGLDPQETYLDILENLKVKNLRLAAYWDEIEPFDSAQGRPFHFEDLDWYINQAQKHQAQVILAVGYKLPRWPECRTPSWLNTADLSYLRERQLKMVEVVIRLYNQNSTISAFQIENEPLLTFGICPPPDKQFLIDELKLVRSLTKKPIIITDSGELTPWIAPMKLSDILGTTLYRKVYDQTWGDIYYPIPAWWYRLKSEIIRKLFAPQNQKTIIAELQTEIWAGQPIMEIPLEEQLRRFPIDQFKHTINYARRTGFDEFYLWGIEWWYYLAQNGHPEYLKYAKNLF